MKKTFVSLLSVAVLGMLLPSCLGDGGDQSYEVQREFGVINIGEVNQIPTTQAAMSNGLTITGGDISNYSTGDIVLITYKASLNNFVSPTTIQTDYAVINEDDVFKSANQKSVIEKPVENNTPSAETAFTTISIQAGHPSEFFLNRWLIGVSANLKKDQEIAGVELYYDENKQTLDNMTLPDDAIILDVKLLKTASTGGSTETATKSKLVPLNLTSLRSLDPKNMENPSTEKITYIWLRYPKYDSSTQTYVEGILQKAMAIAFYPEANK